MSTTANAIAITDRISTLPKEYDQDRIDALHALKDEVFAALAAVEEETRSTTRRALGETRSSGAVDSAESQADGQHLSGTDRAALFNGLQATLQRPENCDGVPQWNVIERSLLANPRMMCNLKRIQDMGAELVVIECLEGRYVEFADAAVNLDVRKQEGALAGLTMKERDDAVEQILQPLPDKQKKSAREWILSQFRRSENQSGLSYVDALVLAVAHGGTLISHEAYNVMARKDEYVVETVTWTWYFKKLSDVMQSDCAPSGTRYCGFARRHEELADGRGSLLGGRVAGLRVLLTA